MATSDSLEDMVSDLKVKVENNRKILLSILGICVSVMALAILSILYTYPTTYTGAVIPITCFSYLTYCLVVKHGFWRIESISPFKGRWLTIQEAPIFNILMIYLLSHLTVLHYISDL